MAQQAEAPPQRMAGRGDGSRDSSSTDARRATDRDDAKRRPRVPRACQAGDECVLRWAARTTPRPMAAGRAQRMQMAQTPVGRHAVHTQQRSAGQA
ncbi:hypothetical protein BM1_07059 [Bipolaris maydis]|nr:hypothetical protein BM1_07059 [Bipolaris maydis]